MIDFEQKTRQRLDIALQKATTTKYIEISSGAISIVADTFTKSFGNKTAVIIADLNTYKAAGEEVNRIISQSNIDSLKPFIFEDNDLYGEIKFVDILETYLNNNDVIPIAVGSGTINDLVKLAAYRCQRQYMVVVTAGSVDGYAAFGASITFEGFKQTFYCPAPRAILADLNVLEKAPQIMNAWGYADLIAKIPSGADWILADILNIEAIDEVSWSLVQEPLRELTANSKGIFTGDKKALTFLAEGLIMSGLAMQYSESSRPASGAEHQFSHLWDNQHHTHNGVAPSHGFKVAIGTLASTALYDMFLELPIEEMNFTLENIKSRWPSFAELETRIRNEFPETKIAEQVIEQSKEKYLEPAELLDKLVLLQKNWPELKEKLKSQLIPFAELKEKLFNINGPVKPEDIGIEFERLKSSYQLAQYIRKRYTILDIMVEGGWLNGSVNEIFSSGTYWKNQ